LLRMGNKEIGGDCVKNEVKQDEKGLIWSLGKGEEVWDIRGGKFKAHRKGV